MFEGILKKGLTLGADIVANNPELVNKMANSVLHNLPESIVDKASNLADKTVKVAKEVIPVPILLEVTQKALKVVSPIDIALADTLNEKQIVIKEEALNSYLAKELKTNEEIKALKVTLLPHNIIQIDAQVTKLKADFEVSQKLILKSFNLNKEEGYLTFKLIDKANIASKSFFGKVICLIASFFLSSVIDEKLIKKLDPENIKIYL